VNATGNTLDPMVIITGAIFKEKYFDNDSNGNVLLGCSGTGYTTDMLSLAWIQHFHKQTKRPKIGWRLLLMDGHGSHLTKEFIDFCYAQKIHPFLMSPHSTHLLHPISIIIKNFLKKVYALQEFNMTEQTSYLHFRE
jgi:hypothetical protein